MKRLIIALIVVFVGVATFGWYEQWFQVSTEPTDHKASMKITVDEDKIREDTQKAKHEAQDAGKELQEKAKQGARKLGHELEQIGNDENTQPDSGGQNHAGSSTK